MVPSHKNSHQNRHGQTDITAQHIPAYLRLLMQYAWVKNDKRSHNKDVLVSDKVRALAIGIVAANVDPEDNLEELRAKTT